MALILMFWLSLPASAQPANGKSLPEPLAAGAQSAEAGAGSAKGSTSHEEAGADLRRNAIGNGSSSRNTKDAVRSKASDLSILTHDASGKLGAPVPLLIKLVRSDGIFVKSINVLGLPQGVTISDSVNVFLSSEDKRDADISEWNLSKIYITQSDARDSSFTLALAAIWTPESSEQINVATSFINVNLSPDRTVAKSRDEPDGLAQPSARRPDPAAGPRAVTVRDAPTSDVMVPEANVAPLGNIAARGRPAPSTIPDKERGVAARAEEPPHVEEPPHAKESPHAMATAQPTPQSNPLVERAKELIRLGDISGARLVLERAQARNAPNATFLLAQTWDPEMLRAWKVRGLRADPDLAKSLYARAGGRQQPDGQQLTATGR